MKTGLVVLAALAAPVGANAGTVTYDFTGTVTGANGNYSSIAVGTTVTGTYTFDFVNANPAQSSGVVGSTTASWLAANDVSNGAPPSELVFLSTAQVGSISFATGLTLNSEVNGNVGGADPYSFGAGDEGVNYSFFSLAGNNPVWSASGLPIFSAALPGNANGNFQTENSNGTLNTLSYQITSLTPAPVPLPAALWLLLSGLGGLGLMRKRES